RRPRGVHRQIGGLLAFGGDMPLADAGALANPRVRRLHLAREVLVGHNPGGEIRPDTGHDRTVHAFTAAAGCSIWPADCSRSSSPRMVSMKPFTAMSTATPMAVA